MNKSFLATFALSLFLSVLLSTNLVAQSTVEERIKQVENNLTENLQTDDAGQMNLQKRMEHYKVNGLSIAVIKDYKIDWVKAYGVADAASKIPVTDKTLFQAASISKSLNAVGVYISIKMAASFQAKLAV